MEPTHEQYPPGRETDSAGWAAPPSPMRGPYGQYAQPAEYEQYAGPASGRVRSRTGIIVFTAFLTELVIIAACGNQWVSDRIHKNGFGGHRLGNHLLADSWLTYTWRFSPRSNLHDLWASQLALVGVTLLFTVLLVLAVVRGPVSFGRAFFGTWMAVIVATLVGAVARGLVEPGDGGSGASRVVRGIFGSAGPGQTAVVGGAGCGLVVALITALVAVATRRPSRVAAEPPGPTSAPYAPPEAPPPYYGEPVGAATPVVGAPPWWDQPQAQPAESSEATAQLPVMDEQAPERPRPIVESGEQPTTQFPRPPDDEQLGHVEPHRD